MVQLVHSALHKMAPYSVRVLTNKPNRSPNLNSHTGVFNTITSTVSSESITGMLPSVLPVGQKAYSALQYGLEGGLLACLSYGTGHSCWQLPRATKQDRKTATINQDSLAISPSKICHVIDHVIDHVINRWSPMVRPSSYYTSTVSLWLHSRCYYIIILHTPLNTPLSLQQWPLEAEG